MTERLVEGPEAAAVADQRAAEAAQRVSPFKAWFGKLATNQGLERHRFRLDVRACDRDRGMGGQRPLVRILRYLANRREHIHDASYLPDGFLIQNTQTGDANATELTLDELIRAIGERTESVHRRGERAGGAARARDAGDRGGEEQTGTGGRRRTPVDPPPGIGRPHTFLNASRAHIVWLRERIDAAFGLQGYIATARGHDGHHEMYTLRFGKRGSLELLPRIYADPRCAAAHKEVARMSGLRRATLARLIPW